MVLIILSPPVSTTDALVQSFSATTSTRGYHLKRLNWWNLYGNKESESCDEPLDEEKSFTYFRSLNNNVKRLQISFS